METTLATPVARPRRSRPPASTAVAILRSTENTKADLVVEWAVREVAGEMRLGIQREIARSIPEADEMVRERYAAEGMPFGDTDAGRCCWLEQIGLRLKMAEPGWRWNEQEVRRVQALNELEALIRRRPR